MRLQTASIVALVAASTVVALPTSQGLPRRPHGHHSLTYSTDSQQDVEAPVEPSSSAHHSLTYSTDSQQDVEAPVEPYSSAHHHHHHHSQQETQRQQQPPRKRDLTYSTDSQQDVEAPVAPYSSAHHHHHHHHHAQQETQRQQQPPRKRDFQGHGRKNKGGHRHHHHQQNDQQGQTPAEEQQPVETRDLGDEFEMVKREPGRAGKIVQWADTVQHVANAVSAVQGAVQQHHRRDLAEENQVDASESGHGKGRKNKSGGKSHRHYRHRHHQQQQQAQEQPATEEQHAVEARGVWEDMELETRNLMEIDELD